MDEHEFRTLKVFSVDDFAEALKSTERGDRIIYYTGDHAGGEMCRFAMRMSDGGFVSLVQRRVANTGQGRFQYEAHRTKKRFK